MRIVALALVSFVGAACQPPAPEPSPTQAAAAIMGEIRPGSPLADLLQRLDQELVRAMEGRLEGDAVNHVRRAEALSDRLLEARLPFEWITHEQYSLEARLRQIQSMADRVLAQIETGVPRDTVLLDLRELRTEVVRLQQTLAQGGGRAPTPLDRLLETGRTPPPPVPRPTPAARPAPATAPLGTPVTTGGGPGT